MKKFFCIVAIGISSACYAQSSISDSTNNKWEIAVTINSVDAQINAPLIASWGWAYSNLTVLGDQHNKSFSVSIIPKVSITDFTTLRVELGMTNINMISHFNGINDSGSTYPETLIKDDTLQQKIFRIMPAVQFTITQSRRLQTYGGFSLGGIFYGRMRWVDQLASNTSPGSDRWVGETDGGYSLGFGGFVGFKVFVVGRLALGTELSSQLMYYHLGGTQSGQRFTDNSPQPPQTRNWSIENNLSTGFQFTKPLFSIQLSYQF